MDERKIVIRDYRHEDAEEWLQVHAIILTMSHSWNYSIQERPLYENDSVLLVATHEDRIIGLFDAEIEPEAGTLCLKKDSRGGYVLEFGRLKEYAGLGIGMKLIEAVRERLLAKGITRMEFWSQDEGAQKYYRKIGLPEINRHMRFRFKPSEEITKILEKDLIGLEYLYGLCVPEVYHEVKKKYDIVTREPLEPHLCVGFEDIFGS